MGVEELFGGAANAATGTSANRPPATAIFGMEPRTIGLPQSAAIRDALDSFLELDLANQDQCASSRHLYNTILKMS